MIWIPPRLFTLCTLSHGEIRCQGMQQCEDKLSFGFSKAMSRDGLPQFSEGARMTDIDTAKSRIMLDKEVNCHPAF